MRQIVCAGIAVSLCTTVFAVCARTPRSAIASIRPCGGEGRGRYGGPGPVPVAGVLTLQCVTVMDMIREAYSPGEPPAAVRPTVTGGPAWIMSDRYTVVAVAQGKPAAAGLRGPMIRAVLETRFKLRVHRDTDARRDLLVIAAIDRPTGP